MSKFSLVFLFTIMALSYSCNKDDISQTTIPDCIQTRINNNEVLGVQVIEFENELHYALYYRDVLPFGTSLDVVNENCEVMCSVGGCIISDCWFEYGDDWVILWEE